MEALFCAGAIGLALLALGGAGVYREFRRVHDFDPWPRTMATILDSGVQEHGSGDDITYSAHVLYRYTVNGVAYNAERDLKSFLNMSGWATDQLANRYAAGRSDLPIAYNPLGPMQHHIADDRNGQPNAAWLGMCAIVIFSGMGLLFIVAFAIWPAY